MISRLRGSAVLGIMLACLIVACEDNGADDSTPTTERPATTVASPGASPQETAPSSSGWTRGAAMPTARAEVASAVLDGRVYVAGGFLPGGQSSDALEAYDPAADTWETRARMPVPLNHAMLAAAGGKLYLVGGYRVFGTPIASVFEYDPAADAWSPESDLPLARGAGIAVGFGGKVYVFGGAGPEPEVPLEYDPATDAWRRLAPMPGGPREHLAATEVSGTIFVIGGRWSNGNTDRVEAYDPAQDGWSERVPMPTARGGLAAAAVGDLVHVVGGEELRPGGTTFEEHEVYSPSRNEWSAAPDAPTARHGLGAQGVGADLYVIGGGETPGLSVSDIVEVYRGP